MSLTINTNMLSLKTQQALTSSTNKMNQAIERMTTGYKINSAKDDAAGYAIATKMDTKISSFDVAKQNLAMGNSLIETANGSMDILTDHLQRIRDLCEQGANGTYSTDSRNAMQEEIDQRVDEINRIIASTEYNDLKLFTGDASTLSTSYTSSVFKATEVKASKGPNGKFIDDVTPETPDVTVTVPADLAQAINDNEKIGIGNAETLAKLAELVNAGTDCSGKTIILTSDISLSAYSSGWTPIGRFDSGTTYAFAGIFNGNGHVVSDLYINSSGLYQGLFGIVEGDIKNVGIEGCNITGGENAASLAGYSEGNITNCYVTGTVSGTDIVGGLVGENYCDISACYTSVTVSGDSNVGGLIGIDDSGSVTNSYTSGTVSGDSYVGGLIGSMNGGTPGANITSCHATGNVTGTGDFVGGLIGDMLKTDMSDSYATGNVSGANKVGGLAGRGFSSISDSYATGNVTGTASAVGGLVGELSAPLTNCYSKGTVTGDDMVGGLVGDAAGAISKSTSYTKSVTGNAIATGSFIGSFSPIETISDCKCYEIAGLEKIGSGGTESANEGITYITSPTPSSSSGITLQVGITSSATSQISFNTSFDIGTLTFDVSDTESARAGLDVADYGLANIINKQTELGAIQNRLDGVSDTIDISIDNLTSSLSTIKDADIAKVSSEYVSAQILQQASATLLSTANQTPSIALQLI